ncbi:MAG TPA: response regulator [Elusimicrobiota bacterium]|nr:response regulator [Elusimicrobiota bacterium]
MGRILIIDDDLMVAQMLREYLFNEGYDVEMMHMAEDGYQSAVASPPDLIMLDVNLPDGTGYQVCGRFRENESTKNVPIIMMTGAARYPNQQQIGKQMGANEYLLKPLNIGLVGERVHSYIGSKRMPRSSILTAPPEPETVESPTQEPAAESHHLPEVANGSPQIAASAPTDSYPPPLTIVPMTELVHEGAGSANETAKAESTAAERSMASRGKRLTALEEALLQTPPAPKRIPIESAPVVPADPRTAATPEPEAAFSPMPTIAAPETLPSPEIAPAPESAAPAAPAASPPSIVDAIAPHAPIIPAPSEATAQLSAPAAKPDSVKAAWIILATHLAVVTAIGASSSIGSRTTVAVLSYVAAGWMLMLGLLVAAAATLDIMLDARAAWRIVGWAGLPIVVETLLRWLGIRIHALAPFTVMLDRTQLSPGLWWSRPLDLFELTSLVILGAALRRQPGATLGKCIVAGAFAVLAWVLTNFGYFHPS